MLHVWEVPALNHILVPVILSKAFYAVPISVFGAASLLNYILDNTVLCWFSEISPPLSPDRKSVV
jgi:hypothetical protein